MFTTRKCLNDQLKQFCGTENYTRHSFSRIHLTDGIVYAKDVHGLNWLVDKIAPQAINLKRHPFQCWKLSRVGKTGCFNLLCTDGNDNLLYKEIIGYSDCESDHVDIWVADNIMMLPSEY
ncbi:hypothetical protein SAMN04488128_103779 [Chitinophaga eiseniae]|uniref:DUF6876 domain-containing protein n=1 Tax=Chitinophaga eiseniae TaxID=634771 RepID=A0A1T4SY67_9BACT|nr:hypothetical protein SAMN04488128_103779 [Chitinophaga eiseniae]